MSLLGFSVNRGNPPSSVRYTCLVRHTCLILRALGIADRALEERQANFSYWGWLSRLPVFCRSFRGMRDSLAPRRRRDGHGRASYWNAQRGIQPRECALPCPAWGGNL